MELKVVTMEIKEVHLTLPVEEARIIRDILGRTHGDSIIVSRIYGALDTAMLGPAESRIEHNGARIGVWDAKSTDV